MVTILNTNDQYGESIEVTAETLEKAVEEMEKTIRACGPDFEDVEITDDDYEIIEE